MPSIFEQQCVYRFTGARWAARDSFCVVPTPSPAVASIEALVNQRVPLPPGSEFDYIDRNRPRSGGPAHRDVDFDREAHPRGRKAHKAKPAMPHSAPIARMYLFGTEAAELYSALLAAGLVEQARDVHQPALGAA